MSRAAPIIAIVGPTGSGKSELSVAVAELIGAEIVNCDSRQIYRGLDIGSAKPSVELRNRVPHHLFDVVEPNEAFDCARYASLARAAIAAIAERGRTSLLVGGTGLYLKAVRYGLFPGPPRDAALRAELMAREAARPGDLHRELVVVDPAAARRVHANDRARIVRALEVYRLTGTPISRWQDEHSFRGDELAMQVVGLEMPRQRLYERLDERCRDMVRRGLVEEVRALLDSGCPPTAAALRSIGYREIADHLAGRCGLDEAIELMARASRQFAKRQLTWFRADPTIRWLDAETATAEHVLTAH